MFEKERKIIPYYVKPKAYKQDIDEETGLKPQTEGIEDIKKILTFQMQLPSKELMIVLKYLKEEEEKGHTITKKDLIDFSKEEEHLKLIRETKRHLANKIKVEKEATDDKNKEDREKAKDYAWINQNIIRELKEEWNLIEIYKIGTNVCVKLNEKGKTMLDYLGY
jgi:hypothetical protein